MSDAIEQAALRLREGDAFPGCRPRTHFSAEKLMSYETEPLTEADLAESDDRGSTTKTASVLRNSAIQIAVREFTARADEFFTALSARKANLGRIDRKNTH